jgi:hypothetical protein
MAKVIARVTNGSWNGSGPVSESGSKTPLAADTGSDADPGVSCPYSLRAGSIAHKRRLGETRKFVFLIVVLRESGFL